MNNKEITNLLFCAKKADKIIWKKLKKLLTKQNKDGTIWNVPQRRAEEQEHIEK